MKIDDMGKAVRQFQPALNGDIGMSLLPPTTTTSGQIARCCCLFVGSEGSHYSKVKQMINDKFYDYDLYYGIKMSVIGSQVVSLSRDGVKS